MGATVPNWATNGKMEAESTLSQEECAQPYTPWRP